MANAKPPRVRFPLGVRGFVFSLMIAGLAAAMITAYTGAVFTDTATATGNVFVAGTLKIRLNGNQTESAMLDVPNMAPGDGYIYPVIVTNPGSLDLRYSLSLAPATYHVGIIDGGNPAQVTTTGPDLITPVDHALVTGDSVTFNGTGITGLDGHAAFPVHKTGPHTFTIDGYDNNAHAIVSGGAGTATGPALGGTFYNALKWQVMKKGTDGTCNPGSDPESTIATAKFAQGTLGSFTNLAGSASTYDQLPASPYYLFGSSTPGINNNKRDLYATTGTETLCIKVVLPWSSSPQNSLQGLSAGFNLVFSAEQTANTP